MELTDVTSEIKPHLAEYLRVHEINPDQKFCCLRPDHNDKNPSAGIVPGKDVVKCFSCGALYDIFDVANYLHTLPLNGTAFVTETIPAVIEQLGLDMDLKDINVGSISPKKRVARNIMKEVSGHARNALIKSKNKTITSEIKSRKWNKDLLDKFHIGQSFDVASMLQGLRDQGIYKQDLEELGLIRADETSTILNNDEGIVFPLLDRGGVPISLAVRNLGDTGPKYKNGFNSILYNKSKYLYGMHLFNPKSKTAYLVEGYTDVMRFSENGVDNALAYCSASFTSDQIAYNLHKTNTKDIVFCLDSDEASIMGILNAIQNNYDALLIYNLKIKLQPEGDPDSYIQENGMDEYMKLPELHFFEAFVRIKLKLGGDEEEIAKEAVEMLISHGSDIAAEKRLQQVVRAFAGKFDAEVIRKEYQKLKNNRAHKIEDKVNYIQKDLMRQFKNSEDSIDIMQSIQGAAHKLDDLHNTDIKSIDMTPISIIERLATMREKEDTRTGTVEAYRLNKFSELESAIDGNWREAGFLTFGGVPNTGKTTLFCNIGIDLVESNSDVCLIIHSIDDEAEVIFTRLISILAAGRYGRIPMNAFRHPNYYGSLYPNLAAAREYGYTKLQEYIMSGAIKIYDQRQGKDVKSIENVLYDHKQNSDRQAIYMLDNFHKIAGAEDRRDFENNSSYLKDMSQQYCIPVLSTVEYKKFDKPREPTNNDIKESGKIEYDAKLCGHLHNDIHTMGDKSKMYVPYEGYALPIIKFIVGKNKLNSFKDSIYFEFDGEAGLYNPIAKKDVFTYKDTNAAYGQFNSEFYQNDYDDNSVAVEEEDYIPFS